jgi:hypothetical protein
MGRASKKPVVSAFHLSTAFYMLEQFLALRVAGRRDHLFMVAMSTSKTIAWGSSSATAAVGLSAMTVNTRARLPPCCGAHGNDPAVLAVASSDILGRLPNHAGVAANRL